MRSYISVLQTAIMAFMFMSSSTNGEPQPHFQFTYALEELSKTAMLTPIAEKVEPFPVEEEVVLDPEEVACMQLNLFHEARNQSERAIAAVAYVVMNRVKHKDYPDSVCGVVTKAKLANGVPLRHKCHFSWYCDGIDDTPNLSNKIEAEAWEKVGEIAKAAMLEEVENPVGDAIMYHADRVSPRWAPAYNQVAQLDEHIFYM